MRLKTLRLPLIFIALLLLGVAAWAADLASAKAAAGWRIKIYAENLPSVDNLALGADGKLYATLELAGGEGRLVRVGAGEHETVLAGLHRPDGLHVFRRRMYVVEEVSDGRVIELDIATGGQRVIARVDKGEGVGTLANGDVVVTEDVVQGRLLRIRKEGGVETLIGGLTRPEGIAIDKDDGVYIAETGTGRVLRFKDGRLDTVVDDLDQPDQLRLAADGALWIAEDTTSGQVLRLMDGRLETVVSGLVRPQGMVFLSDGSLLVAEQGRDRIIAVERESRLIPRGVSWDGSNPAVGAKKNNR